MMSLAGQRTWGGGKGNRGDSEMLGYAIDRRQRRMGRRMGLSGLISWHGLFRVEARDAIVGNGSWLGLPERRICFFES